MTGPPRGPSASFALLALLLAAAPAHAVDIRFLAGIDLFAVNKPDSVDLEEIDLGIGLHTEFRKLAEKLDARLDFRARAPLYGLEPGRYELHQLAVHANRLAGRLDLDVGRFAVPGGFWLITDGAAASLHLGDLFTVSAYGGLRSFTEGRVDATFRGDLLPLAGAAVALDHPLVRGSLSVTYTQDLIELQRGFTANAGAFALDGTSTGDPITVQSSHQHELFVDGQVVLLPHPTLFVAAGLSLGTRYDVTYLAVPGMFAAAPPVAAHPFGSFMAYAIAEWRPLKRLRLSYAFDLDRVKLFTPVQPLDNTLAAAGGSFEDHTLKASARLWRQLRIEARYRLRFRENTDIVQRLEGGVTADDLWVGLGAFATVGGDLYTIDRSTLQRGSAVYTGGLSFVRPWLDVRGGVLYTDAIGSGVAFSTHAKQAMGAGPTSELFPQVLEAQRIAFLRAFFSYRHYFLGLDTEINLDANQTRVLAQAGYSQ